MNEPLKKANVKYIAPIEESELAVRICEARNGLKRPLGATATQALDGMDPEARDAWRRAAKAAMEYWRECIAAANRTN